MTIRSFQAIGAATSSCKCGVIGYAFSWEHGVCPSTPSQERYVQPRELFACSELHINLSPRQRRVVASLSVRPLPAAPHEPVRPRGHCNLVSSHSHITKASHFSKEALHWAQFGFSLADCPQFRWSKASKPVSADFACSTAWSMVAVSGSRHLST